MRRAASPAPEPVQGLPLRHRRTPLLHQERRRSNELWQRDPRRPDSCAGRACPASTTRPVLPLPAASAFERPARPRAVSRRRCILLSYVHARAAARPGRRHASSSGSSTASAGGSIEIFFKTYTEKVWGIPCSEIRAEWAAQRIKGLSLPTRDPQRHAAEPTRRGHQDADRGVRLPAPGPRADVGARAATQVERARAAASTCGRDVARRPARRPPVTRS